MFTFRAERHSLGEFVPEYAVYEAETYRVSPMPPREDVGEAGVAPTHPRRGGLRVALIGGSFPIYGESEIHLEVGQDLPHAIVFVMNRNGKTIDTIRA